MRPPRFGENALRSFRSSHRCLLGYQPLVRKCRKFWWSFWLSLRPVQSGSLRCAQHCPFPGHSRQACSQSLPLTSSPWQRELACRQRPGLLPRLRPACPTVWPQAALSLLTASYLWTRTPWRALGICRMASRWTVLCECRSRTVRVLGCSRKRPSGAHAWLAPDPVQASSVWQGPWPAPAGPLASLRCSPEPARGP